MLKAYFDRERKQGMFPWVKDWSDPQDHLRNERNVRRMPFYTWLWFHPSAFKLIHFGAPVVTFTFFTTGIILLLNTKVSLLAALFLIPIILAVREFIKKMQNRKTTRNTTMYDVYLREYE